MLYGSFGLRGKDNAIWNDISVLVLHASNSSNSIRTCSSNIWKMKQNNNYFQNGNKQVLKELLAVIVLMFFLGSVGFGLAWYKGHTIFQPDLETHEEY